MPGFVYVLAAAFMWGIIGLFTKHLLALNISALEIAFWRAALGGILFAAQAVFTGSAKVHRKDLPMLLGFGLIGVTLFYAAYQLAIRDLGMAMSAVLLYTAPAWVALLSWLVLKERMTMIKTGCVAMTIIGVVSICLGPKLLSGGSMDITPFGLAMGLISGLTYALYYIFGKKFLSRYTTPTIFTYALPFGALLLIPFIHFAPKTPEAWAWLVGIGLVTSYGAFTLYYKGLKLMDATNASVIATFEPLVAAILAYVVYGEHFSLPGYVGSILIVVAVVMVVLSGRKIQRTVGK